MPAEKQAFFLFYPGIRSASTVQRRKAGIDLAGGQRRAAQLRELRLCKPQLAQLLRRDSYGYEINKNIENCSGGEFVLKEATLYTAFRRLAKVINSEDFLL